MQGLKQDWNDKVDNCFVENGYKTSNLGPCMYIENPNENKTIAEVYGWQFLYYLKW